MPGTFARAIGFTALITALSAACPQIAGATGPQFQAVPAADPAACFGAITAKDDEGITSECSALIANEKTPKADRIKALIARADAFARKGQIERAIADDDAVLQLDPTLADIFNARGELWWKKGERPKALRDFDAAIKLKPDHSAARANYKRLAQELERLGAAMAVAGKPSFNCATARLAVEKAICASPELADLDREIAAANVRMLREAKSQAEALTLQREQGTFIASRNASFGRAGYDLRKAMKDRLDRLSGVDGR